MLQRDTARFVDQTVFIWVGLVMFFNSMNLDTTVVVAILGQDSASLVVVFLFRFPDWLWIFYSEHVAFDIHLGTFYSLVWPYCFFDVIHCFVCVSWASAVFHFRICIGFVKQCFIEETPLLSGWLPVIGNQKLRKGLCIKDISIL